MRLLARLDGGIVAAKAWEDAVADTTGWTDISAWPFVNEGDVLDTVVLNHHRLAAALRIEQGYAAAMLAGFTSAALGAPHWYASDGFAMSLLVGAVAAGTDRAYECTDTNRALALRTHTAAQLSAALNDGAALAVLHKQRKNGKLDEIAAATTVAAINSIVW